MPRQKQPIAIVREGVGVLIAAIVVIAYVTLGFAQMSAVVFLGVEVQAPADWSAAMLSLSSAALGYLIGKRVEKDTTPNAFPTAPANACFECGRPFDEPAEFGDGSPGGN